MTPPASSCQCKKRKRILYKECQIAGITFHDLNDIWDELYEGAELALVRQKNNPHDPNAVAVALADDYDGNPDDFDFNYILGYIPRTANEYLATMFDLGWDNLFESELSRIYGHNPYRGSLFISIYIVSKEEWVEDTGCLLRALSLDSRQYSAFSFMLERQGCVYYRWGGFPVSELNLPQKGDIVVFLYRGKQTTTLHLMYCIAVGDDDAACFVKEKDFLHAVDDCCYYVLTHIAGPMVVDTESLSFLTREPVDKLQPESFLSADASFKLKQLFNEYAS